MALPVNIKELVNGHSVEWERLEFKKGWNPEEIVHTICAFANDINNWGGGYVIIGFEENEGKPIFPPYGIAPESVDKLQGEVLNLAYQISPNYFPLVQPYIFDEKQILILWCPAGDNRPYSAPVTQGKGAVSQSYIRFGSRSIIAKDDNLRRLQELTARIPFDDRVNGKAQIDDLDLGLIQAFLQEVRSDLYEESKKISFLDLCSNMKIVGGSSEYLRPLNIGLLFFNRHPEKFLDRAWIELVVHHDDSGKNFTEKYFKGPLHFQLRGVLEYIQNNIIEEIIEKVANKPEATRSFNYPFVAIEEALSNAVYHKSYEMEKPIEVQIFPDRIEILSFPGPVPPVDAQILKQNQRIVARDYRNRRVGDFLKELHLTEGRGTGFPTIRKAMKLNGAPDPIFETDEQSTYFLTVLEKRKGNLSILNNIFFISLDEINQFLNLLSYSKSNQDSNQVSNQVSDQVGDQDSDNEILDNTIYFQLIIDFFESQIKINKVKSDQDSDQVINQASNQAKQIIDRVLGTKIIYILMNLSTPLSRADLLLNIQLSNHTKNREKYIDPLVDLGWIALTIPEKPTHKSQKYKRTIKGEILYTLLTKF